MQIAPKQCLWTEGINGTVVEVEMTATTGKYLKFLLGKVANTPCVINWGDGTKDEYAYTGNDYEAPHTYAEYGKYRIVFKGVCNMGFRTLDGHPQCQYDPCILSVVDYIGQITGSRSAAFKRATNLEKFICPNCRWMGQRDFAYCTKLKQVEIGNNDIYYDGTFQYCSSLKDFSVKSTNVTCWSYMWMGGTVLAELRLGGVSQLATQEFANTPNLQDIWIDNKTVEQIKQVASSGNIVAGYGAKFPWGAASTCRFHGTDGIVLGNGTIIRN